MARRNANGDGSRPRKRADGRWEARYWIETSEGRKRHSLYGATRKECADKLADAMAAKDDEPIFVPTNITVAEFFRQYEDAVRDPMKRRSFETCQDITRLHLLPVLGNLRLKDLSREHVQRLYSRKRNDGLSAASVRRIHDVLRSSLNHAVRWRLIDHNVCGEVSQPRKSSPDIRPLSKEEAKRFLAAAEGSRYHALYVLGLTSGARWGELNGLFWCDLDLDRHVMHIQRALVRGYGAYTLEEPKTRGSRRSVGLTKLAVEALIRHRERQATEGLPVDGDALVFTNTVGKPIHASSFIRRNLKPLLKQAGLPDTNWHAATRHTCTCILLIDFLILLKQIHFHQARDGKVWQSWEASE